MPRSRAGMKLAGHEKEARHHPEHEQKKIRSSRTLRRVSRRSSRLRVPEASKRLKSDEDQHRRQDARYGLPAAGGGIAEQADGAAGQYQQHFERRW